MSASVDTFEFHTTQRCHSVFSCFSPEGEFHCRLVASENVATRLPPDVERTSGSAPRLPINVTLFRLRLTIPPGDGPLSNHNNDQVGSARQRILARHPIPLHSITTPTAARSRLRPVCGSTVRAARSA